LVVIGIISVLIALLFPVFAKVRRKFLVLACPIAYVGEDGGLYLVSANGSSEMRLSEPGLYVESRPGLYSPVQWSPCGRRLGFNASDRVAGQSYTVFMEPMDGRTWKYPGNRFAGFIDYNRWIDTGAWGHNICSVETGHPIGQFRLPNAQHFDTFAPAPPSSGGAFVASWHGDIRPCIGLVKKDFMPGKPIYTWPEQERGHHYHLNPQIDPTGEMVAWGPRFGDGVFIRGLREDPTVPLSVLPVNGVFCDWTEDSHVLVNGYRGDVGFQPGLVIHKTDGTVVRHVPATVKPAAGSVASYRKFGHR
jgi:hypothetical protein